MEGVCVQIPLPCSSKRLFKNLSTDAASFPSVHLAAHLIAKLQLGNISKSKLYSLDETAPHSAAHLFFLMKICISEKSAADPFCAPMLTWCLWLCFTPSGSVSAICSRDTVAAESS